MCNVRVQNLFSSCLILDKINVSVNLKVYIILSFCVIPIQSNSIRAAVSYSVPKYNYQVVLLVVYES